MVICKSLLMGFLFSICLFQAVSRAGDEFDDVIVVLKDDSVLPSEKAKILKSFLAKYPNSDMAFESKILVECFNIPGPRDSSREVIEARLNELHDTASKKWQKKICRFLLLNLYHTEGLEQKVIELGGELSNEGYFKVMDTDSDRQLERLKSAFPFSDGVMRDGVLLQVAIAYENLGRPEEGKKMRKLIGSRGAR